MDVMVKLINQLRLSNNYKSIVVINTDHIICSMLQKLNFETFHAEFARIIFTQTLFVIFHPPQKRLTTDFQALFKNYQN